MAARVLVADASKLGSTAQFADSIAATLRAKTWLEVACVAYLCGRLRAEPT